MKDFDDDMLNHGLRDIESPPKPLSNAIFGSRFSFLYIYAYILCM
jgi:hypothetical protein